MQYLLCNNVNKYVDSLAAYTMLFLLIQNVIVNVIDKLTIKNV